MANSMLAALRNAVHAGPADDIPDSGEVDVPMGGRPDSQQEETSMSETEGKPAADAKAGIPEAEHQAAVDAARGEGKTEGANAERERLSGVLGAEGIKGDGKRMSAALDLAAKSPDMSVEDITAFVTGNVAEAKADTDPAAYEATRTAAAAGLASPAPGAKASSGLIAAAEARFGKSKN